MVNSGNAQRGNCNFVAVGFWKWEYSNLADTTVLGAWLIVRHLGFDFFFCFQLIKRGGRKSPKHPSICFPVSILSTEVAGLLESLPAVPQSTWKNTHKCEKTMQTLQRQTPDLAIILPFQPHCSEVVLLNAAPPYWHNQSPVTFLLFQPRQATDNQSFSQ